jgi:hypothetical protein
MSAFRQSLPSLAVIDVLRLGGPMSKQLVMRVGNGKDESVQILIYDLSAVHQR